MRSAGRARFRAQLACTLTVAACLCCAMALACAQENAQAPELALRFSCSAERMQDGEKIVLADSGSIRLNGARIDAFQWESALLRPPRSADCSIDESDGLVAELRDGVWRIAPRDPLAARAVRGYTYGSGGNCSIRVDRQGDTVRLRPTCPALCGARANFTELAIDAGTGRCRYEQ